MIYKISLLFDLATALLPAVAQQGEPHSGWPPADQLYVDACYQPVGRTPEQIHSDIAIMKKAGFRKIRFRVVRENHDEMQANGIKVLLDISGLPAPIWLHHKYPEVDLVAQNGTRLPPATRYMEDISDSD